MGARELSLEAVEADSLAPPTANTSAVRRLRRVAFDLMRVVDGVVLFVTGMALYFAYVGGVWGNTSVWPRYVAVAAFASIFTVALLNGRKGYRMHPEGRARLVRSGVVCWMLTFAALLGFAFVLKVSSSFSRGWAMSWFAAGLGYFMLGRLWLAAAVARWSRDGGLGEPCAVVGTSSVLDEIVRRFVSDPDSPLRIVGIFSAATDGRASVGSVGGIPVYQGLDVLFARARSGEITRILVALPWDAPGEIDDLLRRLRTLPVRIQLCPDRFLMKLQPRCTEHVCHVPLFTVLERPLDDWSAALKRTEDVVLAALGLLVVAPLIGLIAVAVKLDSPGPAFFRQQRYGFAHNLFTVYKFRTMQVDQSDPAASRLVTRGDPRVTRLGRFLRRTSIDELPQLYNVLRGDMSLVGPRPHATKAKAGGRLYPDVATEYFMRYRVKPGLTGWAQMHGWRGETDTADKLLGRVRFDLDYITNWSLMLDLRILVLTALRLFSSKGAY